MPPSTGKAQRTGAKAPARPPTPSATKAPKTTKALPREGPAGGGKTLTLAHPIEDFISSGLLAAPNGADVLTELFKVRPEDQIGSVIEEMHRRRLGSCIAVYGAGRSEFFDCADLAAYLLEDVFGQAERESWSALKAKLRQAAETPVSTALRKPSVQFRLFDAGDSLERLLPLFRSHRRIPIARGGELCRIVTASDVLEMCWYGLAEDSKATTERMRLSDLLGKQAIAMIPGVLSRLEVSEDLGMVEALRQMVDAEVRVVPVLGDQGAIRSEMSSESVSSPQTRANPSERGVVGQFDLAACRVAFGRSPAAGGGRFWWEDEAITSNIFVEPCMDYLAAAVGAGVHLFSASDSRAPFYNVPWDDSLLRVISRVLQSNTQSVIVQNGNGVGAGGAGGRSRATSSTSSGSEGGGGGHRGTLTAWGLVVAMYEVGSFATLKFDPALKAARRDDKGQNMRPDRRPPTLTRQDVETATSSLNVQSEAQERRCKVHFSDVVELDRLQVPVCPEHGVTSMRYGKPEDKNGADFPALKDWFSEAKAAGYEATCTACSRNLGQITWNPHPPAASLLHGASGVSAGADSPATHTSNGSVGFFAFTTGALSGILPGRAASSPTSGHDSEAAAVARAVAASQAAAAATPRPSALKAGTSKPLPKRISRPPPPPDAAGAGGKDEIATAAAVLPPPASRSFFGLCCAPCHSGRKDQVIATSADSKRASSGGTSPRSPRTPKGAKSGRTSGAGAGTGTGAESDASGSGTGRRKRTSAEGAKSASSTPSPPPD